MKRVLASAIALLALLGAPGTQAQELDRLFLTPEERATLDARRAARVPDRPQTVVVISPKTRVDGQVLRSSGPSTLWVDGRPLPEGVRTEGIRVRQQGARPGEVTIELGDSAQPLDLRVGQSVERDTGTIRGLLGDRDRIEIKK